MIRVAQINDTHEGITKKKHIERMLLKLAEENFDVLVHCGDYSCGTTGANTLGSTVRLIRDIFPVIPYVSVTGNHCLWSDGGYKKDASQGYGLKVRRHPSSTLFWQNYSKILQHFTDNKVWFLDEQGPFRYKDVIIVGHSGWYQNPIAVTKTNDHLYLPQGLEGNTFSFLLKRANDAVLDQLESLSEEDQQKTLVFVSHFPVIKVKEDDPGFDLYSWSASFGEVLHTHYGINYFFNGHAHQHHTGPLRYESGTDYNAPKYQIVEVT